MAESRELTWEQAGIEDETVTEKDIKAAEGMGMLPPGKYLCEVIESKPRQKDFNDYSCIAAGLKMEVVKALQINGRPPEGDAAEALEGKFIFDDINLASPKEKDGMRNRRILIAKRLGLIPMNANGSVVVHAGVWRKEVIGKQAIVTYIHESYTDKKTQATKISGKVAFDGYEHISAIEKYSGHVVGTGAVSIEDTADI